VKHEIIICDVCGRTLRGRRGNVRVSFCASCQRFACEVCWVGSAETCRQCLLSGAGYVATGRLRPAIAETISARSGATPRRQPNERRPPNLGAAAEPATVRTRRRRRLPAWLALLLVAVVIVVAVLLVVRPSQPADGAGLQATQAVSAPVPSLAPMGASPPATPVLHVVVSGDTLRSIAARYLGDETQWPRVYEANREIIADPERLVVGQTLQIPPR